MSNSLCGLNGIDHVDFYPSVFTGPLSLQAKAAAPPPSPKASSTHGAPAVFFRVQDDSKWLWKIRHVRFISNYFEAFHSDISKAKPPRCLRTQLASEASVFIKAQGDLGLYPFYSVSFLFHSCLHLFAFLSLFDFLWLPAEPAEAEAPTPTLSTPLSTPFGSPRGSCDGGKLSKVFEENKF